MIFGIGTDISKVSRFEKWVLNDNLINRFFNEVEILSVEISERQNKMQRLCEHYAARFAAKEAFSKALGTGFVGLELSDFGIKNDENGKPFFVFGEKTKKFIEQKIGCDFKCYVSISHEKDFAVAFVILEY